MLGYRIRFYGRLLLELCLCCGIIAVFSGMTVREGKQALTTAHVRACHCAQRTITGAVQVYCHETNERIDQLDRTVLTDLVRHGLLRDMPDEPDSYRLTPDGTVFCLRHGFAQPPPGTAGAAPRDQLLAAGIYVPDLLRAAVTTPLDAPDQTAWATINPWAALVFLLLLVRLYEYDRDYGLNWVTDKIADAVVAWVRKRRRAARAAAESAGAGVGGGGAAEAGCVPEAPLDDGDVLVSADELAWRRELRMYVDHLDVYGVEPGGQEGDRDEENDKEKYRVGGGTLRPPTSHTTVCTVPYTTVRAYSPKLPPRTVLLPVGC